MKTFFPFFFAQTVTQTDEHSKYRNVEEWNGKDERLGTITMNKNRWTLNTVCANRLDGWGWRCFRFFVCFIIIICLFGLEVEYIAREHLVVVEDHNLVVHARHCVGAAVVHLLKGVVGLAGHDWNEVRVVVFVLCAVLELGVHVFGHDREGVADEHPIEQHDAATLGVALRAVYARSILKNGGEIQSSAEEARICTLQVGKTFVKDVLHLKGGQRKNDLYHVFVHQSCLFS